MSGFCCDTGRLQEGAPVFFLNWSSCLLAEVRPSLCLQKSEKCLFANDHWTRVTLQHKPPSGVNPFAPRSLGNQSATTFFDTPRTVQWTSIRPLPGMVCRTRVSVPPHSQRENTPAELQRATDHNTIPTVAHVHLFPRSQ